MNTYTPIRTAGCPYTQVQGANPLLYSPMRGQWLNLDTPPNTSTVSLGNDKMSTTHRPQIYSEYSNIHSGQIQYYRTPVESIFKDSPTFVYKNTFIDPMGVIKPEFIHYPSKIQDDGCYDSYTRDMMGFREDLMARQIIKLNQNNYNLNKTSCIQKQYQTHHQ